MRLEEGRSYEFGTVEWIGNVAVPTDVLDKGWRQKRKRNLYDRSRVERAAGHRVRGIRRKGLSLPERGAEGDGARLVVDLAFV